MRADRGSGDRTRLTWRAAVVVFLTVFLAGTGLSGAVALWSQQGSAVMTVATGTWTDRSQPGWAWEPEVTAVIPRSSLLTHDLQMSWTTPADAAGSVTYRATLRDKVLLGLIEYEEIRDTTNTSTRYGPEVSLLVEKYDFILVAYVNGVPSAPVVKTVTVYLGGRVTVQ